MEKILITCVADPFAPIESRIVKQVDTMPSIREAVYQFFSVPLNNDLELVVSLTTKKQPSRVLSDAEIDTLVPVCGDNVVFCVVPKGGGGGGGGKDIGRTVAMLAVMVAATVVTMGVGSVLSSGAFFGAKMVTTGWSLGTTILAGLAGAATMAVGGLLVNAMFPASVTADNDLFADYNSSQTYGWDPGSNNEQEGGVVGVLYGTHRVIPSIIGRYVHTDGESQYLNILYAICECEVDSITDTQINKNPITYYDGVEVATRLGTLDQTVIPEFGDTRSDVAVGVKLTTDYITRQTAGNTVEKIGIGIQLPGGLFYANDSGGLTAQSVTFIIQYKLSTDLSWTTLDTYTITEASDSAIRKYYSKGDLTPGTYDVRIKLTGALPASSRYRNDTYWEYLEETIYDDFSYPGVALASLKALATDQLSSSAPSVSFLVTRSTVPVWTGAAYEDKPANNPAWACYDLLHNDVYGGGIPYSRLIYEKFAEWAAWCTTKGYTCNIYLDTAKSMRKALDTIALLGRGVVIQVGSKFSCVYDGDSLPAQRFLFTMGNIVTNSFSEEWLSHEDRANVVEVVYYDADLDYDKQTIVIEQEGFDSLSEEITPVQIDLIGCTDRDMAIKYGKYQLNKNKYLTNTTSFTAASESLACMPGDIIEVAHDVPQWGYSGRIISASASGVVLDRNVTLQPDTDYAITIVHLDTDVRETIDVTGVEEETVTNTLTLDASWDNIPAQFTNYSFGIVNMLTKLFRVIRITRAGADLTTRNIVALEHVTDVYNDSVTIPSFVNPSALDLVAGLRATEILRPRADGVVVSIASLSWRGASVKWQVYISSTSSSGPWTLLGETGRTYYEIEGLVADKTYYFAVSATHSPEDASTASLTPTGTPYVPDVPEGLNASVVDNTIVVTWTASANIGIDGYNIYCNDVLKVAGFKGNRYVYKETLTAGDYDFKIAALNSAGEESTQTDEVTVSISAPATPSPSHTIAGEILTITWADCTGSLPIKHYTVNGVINGNGRTFVKRINWTGTETFSIVAVDASGNTSSAGSSSVTVTAIPTPTDLTATGQTYAVKLTITHASLTTKDVVEVWESTTNNREDAVHVGDTPSTSFVRTGLPLVATRYYWVRIRDIYGNLGSWYPASSTAGVEGSASTDPADYLTILTGQISEDELIDSLNDRIDWIDTEEFIFDEDIIEPNIYNGIAGAYSGLYNLSHTNKDSINDLVAITLAQAEEIAGMSAEISGLVTTEWSATDSYDVGRFVVHNDVVYRCIQAYTYPPAKEPGVDTAYWEESEALHTLVSEIETRVDTLEGEIVNKVSTTTFNALENRVDTAESNITQNSADILLRVTQTEFEAFASAFLPDFSTSNTYDVYDWVRYEGDSYQCIKTIDFTPAPLPTDTEYWELSEFANVFSSIINQVEINTEGISLTSTAITGDLAYLFDSVAIRTFETGVYVETVADIDGLDLRVTQAYIDIDGAEADILLHASLIDGLTGRMSQAEIDIDGANAQIALKASQTSLDATNADLTAAELVIDGHTASIALHAASISTLQSTTGTHTTQINQAQIDIDAAEAEILLRATKTELDGTLAPVYSSTTTYNTGDEVRYYSTSWKLYKCKLNGTLNIVPTNTTYWTALSALSGRMSQAEVDIDAAEAAITLKASQTSLDTTNGRVSAAELNISALETETGEMQAQYTVKLNVNNHVAGIGLLLEESGYSEFVILSDKFMVVNPTDTMSPKAVFTVGNVNGVSAVGINGDLIIDGSILARNIGANEIIANAANIKDALITNAKLVNATIEAAKIKDGTITGAKIASATIENANIKDATIASAKIASLTADKITTGTIGAQTINVGDSHLVMDGANKVIKVYDADDNLRVELGLLS